MSDNTTMTMAFGLGTLHGACPKTRIAVELRGRATQGGGVESRRDSKLPIFSKGRIRFIIGAYEIAITSRDR
jgi:hypothetical protein